MSRPTVLVVEDDLSLREALCETLSSARYPVATATDGEDALQVLQRREVTMVISDVNMRPMDGRTLLKRLKNGYPHLPVVLMSAFGSVSDVVEAMREGAADYLTKPFDAAVLLQMVSRFVGVSPQTDTQLIAVDPRTREIAVLARRVAASDATVLLTGESGTGKEVFAHYIHRHSPRTGGPFVAINCAAIPENMLEAILFGYEKGAFTGAHEAKPGKFELANRGTLLLDEISEMALGLQAKLLRVLQEREVERLGGRRPITLDVRVLATTNCDLGVGVREGRFREDLYYRLNVFPLRLPPLRERRQDILPLAQRFAQVHRSGCSAARIDGGAGRLLLGHGWPGNVRELDNIIQRALILGSGETIEAQDIRFEVGMVPAQVGAGGEGAPETVPDPALEQDLKTREQELILEALRQGKGSRKEAAARLGISARTLRYKLARLREAGVPIPG
jgi:two-component system response regulator FlrC